MQRILVRIFCGIALWGLILPFGVLAQPPVPATPPTDLSGQALRNWLKQNWYDSKHSSLGYDGARNAMYTFIDKRPDGRLYCVYSGFNVSATSNPSPINCEHSIPQSWFNQASPMRADIHHLYPTHQDVNSARGSDPFGEIPDNQTVRWYIGSTSWPGPQSNIPSSNIDAYSEDTNSSFEPREDHKGDLARAAFYFYTMYPSQAGAITRLASLNTLYQWHIQDPVSDWERGRNTRTATRQGNYNPYINFPEIIARAWDINANVSPTLAFVNGSGQITQSTTNQTYTANLSLSPAAGSAVTATVSIDPSSTAQAAQYSLLTTSVSIAAGQTSGQVQVQINGTASPLPSRTIVLRLSSPSTGTVLGGTVTHTITLSDGSTPPPSVTPILTVRNAVDAGGSPTTTAPVTIAGTVHGLNQNTTNANFQFTLIDGTAGIGLRYVGTNALITPALAEGDSIVVTGTVNSFRGLMQVTPTNIVRVATGKPRRNPLTVTVLDEVSESQLVRIENVAVNGSQWQASPTAAFNVDVTLPSGQTYVMRIVQATTGLYGRSFDQVFGVPATNTTARFTIVGLGGQFAASANPPFAGGYQLLPYRATDITSFQPCNAAPSQAATSLNVTNLSANAATISWTNGNGSRRLVLAKAGSPIVAGDLPANGQNYTANAQYGTAGTGLGAAFVVYNGTANSFNLTGLTAGTTYHLTVVEAACTPLLYAGTGALTANFTTTTTVCTAPSTAATSFGVSNVSVTGATLSWTNGNGSRRLVILKAGSAVTTADLPVNGQTYTANAQFGSGSSAIGGGYVVYDGTANNFIVTGLLANTTYHAAVIEYSCTIPQYGSTRLSGSFSTSCNAPGTAAENLLVTPSINQAAISWTSGSGTTRLVLLKASNPFTAADLPTNGQSYTANAQFGTTGTALGGAFVVYQGAAGSVTVSGLSPLTTYYVAVIEAGCTPVQYQTGIYLSGSLTTTSPEPAIATFDGLSTSTTEGQTIEVRLVLSKPSPLAAVAEIEIQTDLVYGAGAQYTTVPSAPSGFINLPIAQGATSATFTLTFTANVTGQELQKSLRLLLTDNSSNVDVATPDQYLIIIRPSRPTGLEEDMWRAGIRLMPNPATHQLSIDAAAFEGQLRRVAFLTADGRQVFEQPLSAPQSQVSLTALPAGLYLVQLHTDKGIYTGRIVVE